MRDPLPITLERLASLQARLDGGSSLPELLAREGLSADVFDRAKRGWLARMNAEVAQRSFLLAQRYQDAYVSERPELSAVIGQGESTWQVSAAASEDIDGTAMALNLDLGAALPFFDDGEAAPPPLVDDDAPEEVEDAIPEWKDPTKATQFVSALPDITALPFGDEVAEEPPPAPIPKPPPAPAPPAPAPAPPAPPAAAARDDLDGTAMVSSLNLGEALPFRGEAPAPPPAAPASPRSPNVDGTAMVSSLDLEAALPFDGKVPTAASENVDGTVMVGELKLDLDSVLPFEGEAAPPSAAADDLPPMPAGDIDGTAFAPAPLAGAPTPFAPPPAPIELSESQYASFCGERHYAPAAATAIHQRYGLRDATQARALDAHWQARRERDPGLAARLDHLTAQYMAWLKTQRGH